MGTRADFYVGRGASAEWLGSIAWDAYPEGLPDDVLDAKTEKLFRQRVETFLADREDATRPADGWPWPWEDSGTTDYSYAFDGGVWITCFGHGWRTTKEWRAHDAALRLYEGRADDEKGEEPPELWDDGKVEFPDMKDRQNVTLGKRSGVIVVGGR